jgi:hypothetical protein
MGELGIGQLQVGELSMAVLREALDSLSGFRFRSHTEFGPVSATPCQSLLIAGRAILGSDLHEWLFLLVTV